MKCPLCKIKLVRKQYEGVNIDACESCKGTLLQTQRLKSIEARRDKSEDELLYEMVKSGADTDQKLRCSRCLSMMEKLKKKIGSTSFSFDRCDKCQLVWLDAGELAKWQVVYQFSEKGEEALAFQNRLKNMTPEQRHDLEKRISNLPDSNLGTELAATTCEGAASLFLELLFSF